MKRNREGGKVKEEEEEGKGRNERELKIVSTILVDPKRALTFSSPPLLFTRAIKVDYEHPHLSTTMPGNRENTI